MYRNLDRNGPLALVFNALFLLFLLAPLVVVILVSLTPEGYLSYPTNGVSLRWFRAILDNPQFIDAFYNSAVLAVLSASLATLIAVPAALAVARYRFKGRDALTTLFLSPLMIPQIVLGVAFLRFFTQLGVSGTFASLVAAHVVVVVPYTLRLVLASVVGLDREAERAAISLGASPWTSFRRVTLPMILPGVTGGWMLALIMSFDELTMTVFVASPGNTTLPVQMYNYIDQSVDPLIASVSAVIILITIAFMLLIDRLFGLDKVLTGKG
ncbi:ABC transporter permease [Halotalea alkalilenta]|uniref:ABC transporter permease n=1 Tax=Halotalea alkalilenta TaxID=376489 RepID=A0A172YDP6_9GAMM|nr:ABC transporter permease [Halotalea alkalilenta]ANF57390.1 ABC transporter permease [Halotalea alkalilenta]